MTNERCTATASRDEARQEALGLAAACRVLALGLARPTEAARRFLAESAGLPGDGPLAAAFAAVAREASVADLDSLRASHLRVFDPRREPHPYEAEFRCEHFQQRAETLADLAGFYRAFGAQPDTERPDHIACELDFVSLLGVKEAKALAEGETEKASVCQEARRKFLDEHLLAWAGDFAAAFGPRTRNPKDAFLKAVLDAFELVARLYGEHH